MAKYLISRDKKIVNWMVATVFVLAPIKAFIVCDCAIGIFCNDPTAEVRLDGQLIHPGPKEGFVVYPWKDTFEVEIKTRRGIDKTRIFPLAPESDFGHISIDRDKIHYMVVHTPIP